MFAATNFVKRLFGSHSPLVRRNSAKPRTSLKVESLETRDLMASGITSWTDVAQGTLYVGGSLQSDSIQIRFADGHIQIVDQNAGEVVPIQVTNQGVTQPFQSIDRNLIPYYLIVSTSEGNNLVEVSEDAANPAKPIAMYGGQSDDTLIGGSANDAIYGLGGTDAIHGGGGDDYLVAGYGIANEVPASGREFIDGGEGKDTLLGGRGEDQLDGGGGDDSIMGGEGSDLLFGSSGNDTLLGGFGFDDLNGGADNDTLFGEEDNDTLGGGIGRDVIDGGFGIDQFRETIQTQAYLSNGLFLEGTTLMLNRYVPRADVLMGVEEARLTSIGKNPRVNANNFTGRADLFGPNSTAMNFPIQGRNRSYSFFNVGPEIWARYNETAGILGDIIRDEQPAANGGSMLRCKHGAVFFSPGTGARIVYGDIWLKYLALANAKDAFGTPVHTILGLPTTDEMDAVPGGRVSQFQGGGIFWSRATKAHVVYGAIGAKYSDPILQFTIGLPITDELPGKDGSRYSRFEYGEIFWSGHGTFVVSGLIAKRYRALGAERSYLGFPTSDPMLLENGGRYSQFQFGTIVVTLGVAHDSAGSATLTFVDGKRVLKVSGSSFGETIRIRNVRGNFSVDGMPILVHTLISGPAVFSSVATGWVDSVEVDALAGSDTVEMVDHESYSPVPMFVNGGNGHDTIIGGLGNDTLHGGTGNDNLLGMDGNDGLFGGTGSDTARGGMGADRFLIMENQDNRNTTVDRWVDDATVIFRDGPAMTYKGTDHLPGMWTMPDIIAIDKALAAMHATNVKLLWGNYPERSSMVLIRVFGTNGTAGAWNSDGIITLPDNAFTSADWLRETIIHEIGHNFEDENPNWGSFLSISGWTQSDPKDPAFTRIDKYEQTWWYRTASEFRTANNSYSKTHPLDDFAESFAGYFIGDTTQIPLKTQFITNWLNQI